MIIPVSHDLGHPKETPRILYVQLGARTLVSYFLGSTSIPYVREHRESSSHRGGQHEHTYLRGPSGPGSYPLSPCPVDGLHDITLGLVPTRFGHAYQRYVSDLLLPPGPPNLYRVLTRRLTSFRRPRFRDSTLPVEL